MDKADTEQVATLEDAVCIMDAISVPCRPEDEADQAYYDWEDEDVVFIGPPKSRRRVTARVIGRRRGTPLVWAGDFEED